MNSKQLQYAITLSKVLNVSRAAEELDMTQPALSKQILSLEKEIGVTLFDRSSAPLTLTQAGEEFIKAAKEILFKEEALRHSMEDFKAGNKGRLTIGISPFRATYFLSDVIIGLKKQYPGLQVVLNEKNSALLQKDTAEGLLDFSVLNLPVDESLFDIIPLNPEPVVLVVPQEFAKAIKSVPNEEERGFPVVDLKECAKLPFIVLGKTQELRILFEKLCAAEYISPNIAAEVVGISTAFNLAAAGIGATILPSEFVKGNLKNDELLVFTLKNSACIRQPAIVVRKGQHISKYAKAAIEIISKK